MTELPSPLTPAGCDLRDFPFMPLDVMRLRDSDLAAVPDAEVFRGAVLAWCASWHQIPAASLPDDDAAIARLVGMGRDVKGWRKLRDAGALRRFVKCADGRLYHPVVAEKANEAWQRKGSYQAFIDSQSQKGKMGAAKRWSRKSDSHGHSHGYKPDDSLKGQGQGEDRVPLGKPNGRNATELPLGDTPKPSKPQDPWAEVYRRGREILGSSAGGIITNLRKTFDDKPRKVMAKLEDAAEQREPVPWINAFLWKHGPPGLEGIGPMDSS